jgi:hypothetical protein
MFYSSQNILYIQGMVAMQMTVVIMVTGNFICMMYRFASYYKLSNSMDILYIHYLYYLYCLYLFIIVLRNNQLNTININHYNKPNTSIHTTHIYYLCNFFMYPTDNSHNLYYYCMYY